jgi:hypothetical protein
VADAFALDIGHGLRNPGLEVTRVHAREHGTGLDPVDIHASISALTFSNVSNQHTFGLIFNQDPASPNAIAVRRKNIIDMVLRFMLA